METRIVALAALLLLGTACASPTQSSSAKPATSAVASSNAAGKGPADKRNEIVCESVKEVGSNIPTRICKTKGQLADEAELTQQNLNMPLNRPAGGN